MCWNRTLLLGFYTRQACLAQSSTATDASELVQMQRCAYFHQCQPQKIQSRPMLRLPRTAIFLGKANTPNAIYRAGFNQQLRTGCQQKRRQGRILAKFGLIATQYDAKACRQPSVRIKALHLATQGFGLVRAGSLQNRLACCTVTKQTGFFSHHVLLCMMVLLPL